MKLVRFTGGMLLGALVGGGLVLLLAPRSGEGTRALVQDWLQSVWREGQEAAEAKRRELMAQLEELQSAGR
jgi:gas vesicle protein